MGHDHGSGSCCGGSRGMMHDRGMRCGSSHGSGHGWRRFVSPDEERELVQSYISELEKELAGAKARLAELAEK
jgi:hypothetical protein